MHEPHQDKKYLILTMLVISILICMKVADV